MSPDLEQFEGLVKETASQIVAGGVELEFDDVCQLLRLKAWTAAETFDASIAANAKHLSQPRDRYGRTPIQRYVFLCVANFRKDLEKRPRRFNRSLDEMRDDLTAGAQANPSLSPARADRFDAKYLAVEDTHPFEEDDESYLPPDLTEIERRVIALKLEGRHLFQIDLELGLSRVQRQKVMESIRVKLEHLNPARGQRTGPMRPLPPAELHRARVLEALAA